MCPLIVCKFSSQWYFDLGTQLVRTPDIAQGVRDTLSSNWRPTIMRTPDIPQGVRDTLPTHYSAPPDSRQAGRYTAAAVKQVARTQARGGGPPELFPGVHTPSPPYQRTADNHTPTPLPLSPHCTLQGIHKCQNVPFAKYY